MAIAKGVPSEYVLIKEKFDIEDYLRLLKYIVENRKNKPETPEEEQDEY